MNRTGAPARRLRSWRRWSAVLVTPVALLAGCGGDDTAEAESTGTTVATAETLPYTEVNADGHGDGDTEGHDLATGDNTPKDPEGRFFLHPGDRGPDVEQLQSRLVALGAPIGDADGIYGDHTLHAVLEFQTNEGLTADGVVGTKTWHALDEPAAKINWNEPDVPGSYDSTPVGKPTGSPTAPPTSGPAAKGDGADVGSHPSTDPAATGTWNRAVVTLSNQTATFYDENGNIALQAPISSGKNGLTPVGTFHVQSKSPRAYAGNGVYMDSMTRFNGGIGFHSIPKQQSGQDLPTPLGQAPVSHGCIRMADDQAKLVFEHLAIGATVEVHK